MNIGASLPFCPVRVWRRPPRRSDRRGGSFTDARLDPGVGADDNDGPHRSSLCGGDQGRGDAKLRIGEDRGLEDPSAVGLRQCAGTVLATTALYLLNVHGNASPRPLNLILGGHAAPQCWRHVVLPAFAVADGWAPPGLCRSEAYRPRPAARRICTRGARGAHLCRRWRPRHDRVGLALTLNRHTHRSARRFGHRACGCADADRRTRPMVARFGELAACSNAIARCRSGGRSGKSFQLPAT